MHLVLATRQSNHEDSFFFSLRVCASICSLTDFVSSRPTSDLASPPSEMNDSPPASSSTNLTPKASGLLHRQSSDESNSQQSKRKFSLSQYKERKRLKSDELQQNPLTDTDMRIQPMTKVSERRIPRASSIALHLLRRLLRRGPSRRTPRISLRLPRSSALNRTKLVKVGIAARRLATISVLFSSRYRYEK